MADVTVKTIETRLQLKYDTYANWTNADLGENKGANLVLLKGEIGIVEIEAKRANDPTVQTPAPTVLFKVGDGEHKFSELNWASALAADVYAWAKAETVALAEVVVNEETGEKKQYLQFKTGDVVNHSVDLSAFATDAEVAALTTALDARIAAIEGTLGTDNGAAGSVSARLDSAETKLDAILGHAADGETEAKVGLIDQALADANAYTDEQVSAAVGTKANGEVAATGLLKEIADAQSAAVTAANGYTDGKVATLEAKDSELVAEDQRLDKAITDEVQARKDADKAITDVIGTGFEATEAGTVAAKVKAAQDAADAAQDAVDALTATGGEVAKNTAAIAQLGTDLAAETKAREDGDKALDERLVKVETFFAGAYGEDGKALNEALDTLVEIQDYLDGDGTAAGTLVDKVAQNASDIADLQATLADGGDFEKRVDAVEAKASANASAIESLQALTAGEFGEGKTIKDAIDAAAQLGQTGIDNAATAQAAADAAQKDVDDLAAIVGKEAVGTAGQAGYEEATGLVKAINDVNATATDAQARVAAVEPRIEQAEKDIDALEAIVKTGENTNAQLRADIEALEAIIVTGADANATLGGEIDAIAAKVNHETTGLAATKKIADDNAADIAEIKADYLKASDVYVFNCGSSTTVTHTVPVTPAE